jgi:DNA helicase IV
VDACIEKANEGIKKLRRFEGNSINAMMADCQDSLDDLKNKWYIKLIEKRDKKKKQTKIMVIVIIVLFAAMMIGLAIAS